MTNLIKNFSEGFMKNPTITFVIVALLACYYLYSDLSSFITQQQEVLTRQVEAQTKTVEVLNNISQRITEIELKIYNQQ